MLAGSCRACHFLSLSLCFPSVGTGPREAQRKRPHWQRFPAVCTGGEIGGAERLAGAGGIGMAGTILGTSPPAPMHPKAQTANDYPVCQAKMFPVQSGSTHQVPPQALPRSLHSLAAVGQSPTHPTWLALHSTTTPVSYSHQP